MAEGAGRRAEGAVRVDAIRTAPDRTVPNRTAPDDAIGPRIAIGIASTGRADMLAQTLPLLAAQSEPADRVLLSVGEAGDVHAATLDGLPFSATVLSGPRGLTRQRNRILDAAGDVDAVLFVDDDYLLAPDFLARCRALLRARPDCAVATGRVIADGIGGAGYGVAEGLAMLEGDVAPADPPPPVPTYNAYGCNMLVGMHAVRWGAVRFDEALPLYGWLEDVDFSRRAGRHGTILRDERLRGVHLGTKSGRSPGTRLGYSQIANPLYLIVRGTMAPHRAVRLMARNVAANTVRSARPEPWIDRVGRLRGNALALLDALRGRLSPMRAADLS